MKLSEDTLRLVDQVVTDWNGNYGLCPECDTQEHYRSADQEYNRMHAMMHEIYKDTDA